tara:strand:- start:8849 stop:9532 length:684 start_codon:yes stop_codon:yes gene_type:complete
MSDKTDVRPEAEIFQEVLRDAALHAMLGVGKAFDAEEVPLDEVFIGIMDRMWEFGTVRDFPPAEAFCRQFCEWAGVRFDAARWRADVSVQAQWGVYRAAVQVLSALPVPQAVAAAKPRRGDIGQRGFDRVAGASDRERIDPPPAARRAKPVPLTDVKGIGKATAAKLERAGIDSVTTLAALPREGLIEHLGQSCDSPEACDIAAEVVIKGGLIDAASALIGAAAKQG